MKRIAWLIEDALSLAGAVLLAVCIALACAVVLGLAVRLSFWAAGIG